MCCSDDRLLRALIYFTTPWIDTDDSSLVAAVCMQIWQNCTASSTMKDLWDWAGEEDEVVKGAIIKETLVAMAEDIMLGRLISATTAKAVPTRVSHPPPPHLTSFTLSNVWAFSFVNARACQHDPPLCRTRIVR